MSHDNPSADPQGAYVTALVAWRREYVRAALDRNRWNVSAAAREVGISRVGLSKMITRFGIRRPFRCPLCGS